ncbi:MAG: hypothetical protein IKW52_06315 [Alistipes sp.]|nr:hypothetical protein [Alistipes sp.]
MMNRIFGVLFTLIAIGIIALAAYNFGNYRSIFFGKDKATEESVSEDVSEEDYAMEAIDEQESTDSDMPSVDSLVMEELPLTE